MEGMSTPERLTAFCSAFDEAGGTGTKMLIRRVWLGQVQAEVVDRQRKVYESYSSSDRPFADDQTVADDDPLSMAERLAELTRQVGADALNLRVHLPGFTPEQIRQQIERLAAEVVPELRRRLAA